MSVSLFSALAATDLLGAGQLITNIPLETLAILSNYDSLPMVSSAEVVIFGSFKRLVASFRGAGVALRDIQACFVTRRKSLCVCGAGATLSFKNMHCSFRGRRIILDVSIVILQIALAGLRQVASRCRFRGRRNIL